MFKARFLTGLAALLLVGLPLWLTFSAGQPFTQLINTLGALDQPGRSIANGVFLLTGAFWMGSVEAVRKQLEPQAMDAWVRFGVIAFAASLIARLVFPCDQSCPLDGSTNQLVHNTLVWVLYSGALVVAWRLPLSGTWARLLQAAAVICFVLLQWAFWHRQAWPGLWQRGYELAFALLWWLWVERLARSQRASRAYD